MGRSDKHKRRVIVLARPPVGGGLNPLVELGTATSLRGARMILRRHGYPAGATMRGERSVIDAMMGPGCMRWPSDFRYEFTD